MRYSSLHNSEHFVIRELLSSRKGTNCKRLKWTYPEETKRQLVFSFLAVKPNNWAGFQKETICEAERMGQMELKIILEFPAPKKLTTIHTYIHFIFFYFFIFFFFQIKNTTCPRIAYASLGGSCHQPEMRCGISRQFLAHLLN